MRPPHASRFQGPGQVATVMMTMSIAVGATVQERAADVRAFEARRFDAMIRLDVQAVADCLDEGLTYTHSSGETESKAQFLETLRGGRIKYERIEPKDIDVRPE